MSEQSMTMDWIRVVEQGNGVNHGVGAEHGSKVVGQCNYRVDQQSVPVRPSKVIGRNWMYRQNKAVGTF